MSQFKGHMILNDAQGNVGSVRPISFMETGTISSATVGSHGGGHPAYLFGFHPYINRWSAPAPQMVAPQQIPQVAPAPQQQLIPQVAPLQQQVISQQVQRMQNGLPGVQPMEVAYPQQMGPQYPQQQFGQQQFVQQFNGQLLSQPMFQMGNGVFESQLLVQ